MRQIILDTETTGLSPEDGHRIIEIGCVELLNRKLTGNRFHVYLNPERQIDQGAVDVHGLDNTFLADKPLFAQIVDDFITFIAGAELIIHNAPFDVGFINAELKRQKHSSKSVAEVCSVLDTLALARKKHPGQRNSLDALCKRYGINNSHRDLHGALLDAEILADVYLAMTGGQSDLLLEPEKSGEEDAPKQEVKTVQAKKRSKTRPALSVIKCTEAETALHDERLQALEKSSGGKCLWLQADEATA